MRIIFMGTPDFAVPTLQAILAAGHEVVAVYTQPPRPAGRGMEKRKSPVHLAAEAAGLTVLTPESLKRGVEAVRFAGFDAHVAVVVAYGLILPRSILEAPPDGCLNLHASLLPRWRGAAPIVRAILAGDAKTGICIMRVDETLDTGPVCLVERLEIGPDETAGELHDRLAASGAQLMVEALGEVARGSLIFHPQAGEGATYAKKIEHAETRIDWSRRAHDVHNLIRGLSPSPGAWFEAEINGKPERVKALRSTLADGQGPPGTLLDDGLTVACGDGAVRLAQVQRAGKRPMGAEEFLRGAALAPGSLVL
jgi:methionyl-tRNA formyltransferase